MKKRVPIKRPKAKRPTQKAASALVKVAWPRGKELKVKEVLAYDLQGRAYLLDVLSVTVR